MSPLSPEVGLELVAIIIYDVVMLTLLKQSQKHVTIYLDLLKNIQEETNVKSMYCYGIKI